MNFFQTSIAVIATLTLTACATQYQSSGLTGGHFETKGPGKLEKVTFSANGYTSAELTKKYELYRCAEVAKANNKPFFIMYESLIGAARNIPADSPRIGLVQNKPVATAFILLLDGPQQGALETKAILEDLHDVVTAGKLNKS